MTVVKHFTDALNKVFFFKIMHHLKSPPPPFTADPLGRLLCLEPSSHLLTDPRVPLSAPI